MSIYLVFDSLLHFFFIPLFFYSFFFFFFFFFFFIFFFIFFFVIYLFFFLSLNQFANSLIYRIQRLTEETINSG